MYCIFFIHSSVNRHLGYFYVLAIVNSTAVNIGVHKSFQTTVFSEYMPWLGMVGSCASSIFKFLKGLHIVPHSGCPNLHSPQQCRRFFYSPHPLLTCLLRGLYAGQEAAVRTGHGTTDGLQIGKEYVKAVYCHPA